MQLVVANGLLHLAGCYGVESSHLSSWMGSRMGTISLLLVALVLGWLGTLCLVRDVSRLQRRDFLIATGGALVAGLLLPRMGLEIWGENGLRMSSLSAMAAASVLTLMVANLIRGRGIRAGTLLRPRADSRTV
jgi:hypothetical protein